MAGVTSSIERFCLSCEGDRWYITVPWNKAEQFHSYLHRCGTPSTLVLDPQDRQAQLELWPGVELDQVRKVLDYMSSE